MLGDNLDRLRKFEDGLKACLIKRFGKVMPPQKIEYLKAQTYVIGNEFDSGIDRDTFQGDVLRRMLNSIIDVACNVEISTDGLNNSTLVYGRDLEDGIIEYYTQELSVLFKFGVNAVPELNELMQMAVRLKETYGDQLDFKVFNENATRILDNPALKDVDEKCDYKIVHDYVEALKKDDSKKEVDSRFYDGITTKYGTVQLIYLGRKQYIKYIDKDGNLHLVNSQNNPLVRKVYTERIANLRADEELNAEELFNELCKYASGEAFSPIELSNLDRLNNQVTMNNFVNTSEEPTTEMFTNANVEPNEEPASQPADMSGRQLTEQEYYELCMKYAEGTISDEEYNALVNSTPDLIPDAPVETDAPSLTRGNGKPRGFASKTILIYILMIVTFLGVFVGAMIFSMTN